MDQNNRFNPQIPHGVLGKLNAVVDNNNIPTPTSPIRVCLTDTISPKDYPPIDIYVAARCEIDSTQGVRTGIGILFGRGSIFNVSEALQGPRNQKNAEINVLRRAISIAKSVNRRDIHLYTESDFIHLVGTQWLGVAQASNHLLLCEEEDHQSYIHDFTHLVEESRNVQFIWEFVVCPGLNPGLRRAVHFAENGKCQCPWHRPE